MNPRAQRSRYQNLVARLATPAYLRSVDGKIIAANVAGGEMLALFAPAEDENRVLATGETQVIERGDGVAILLTRIELDRVPHVLAIGSAPSPGTLAAELGFTTDGVCGALANGEIFSVNDAFANILGVPINALLGTNFRDYLHLPDRRTLRSIYRRMVATGRSESVVRLVRPDGDERCVWLTMVQRVDGGFFASMRDITAERQFDHQMQDAILRLHSIQVELEEANARLRVLASTDGLTGLDNHREFQSQLASQIEIAGRYGRSLSLIMVDIDHFKAFNDEFGHPEGDEVLELAAAILVREARSSDFVARYGGEEFAILLPETDLNGAFSLAERIRRAFDNEPWPLRKVTVSLGVAQWKHSMIGPDLIYDADQALYAAKAAGRNQVQASAVT